MKVFFTYEQQIKKLKQMGLIITDEAAAIACLTMEGYYNVINGYSPIFKRGHDFIPGTTFDDICALYDFDRDLRSMIYQYTSSIESNVKALIAHEFSRVHGVLETEYLTPSSFTSRAGAADDVAELIASCQKTIEDARRKNSNKYREYIAHNASEHGHVPMWVLVRALTFGTTSIFYKNMKPEEQKVIAEIYHLSPAQLSNMLEVAVSFRNIVAHGERTFCARLPKTRLSPNLSITRKLCLAKNAKGEIRFGRNDFLALLICCKYLLSPRDISLLIDGLRQRLTQLSGQLGAEHMAHIRTAMGLRSDSWTLLPKLKIEEGASDASAVKAPDPCGR